MSLSGWDSSQPENWTPLAAQENMSSNRASVGLDLDLLNAAPNVDYSDLTLSESFGFSGNTNQDMEYWPPDRLSNEMPPFSFTESSLLVNSALPPIIQTDLQGSDSVSQYQLDETNSISFYNGPSPQENSDHMEHSWPSYISDASLVPWIGVYFDRLHPTIPVLNRNSVFTQVLAGDHHRNPLFASMLLSLCAFAITQPVFISEHPSSSSRASQAKQLMNEAIKMRSSFDFGENPTLEGVLTSFFLFGCLFGSNQHNAAWLRLREAIDLAVTMRLNDPESYSRLSADERGQRLRMFLVLSISERLATPCHCRASTTSS